MQRTITVTCEEAHQIKSSRPRGSITSNTMITITNISIMLSHRSLTSCQVSNYSDQALSCISYLFLSRLCLSFGSVIAMYIALTQTLLTVTVVDALLELLADWFAAQKAYDGQWPKEGKWIWVEKRFVPVTSTMHPINKLVLIGLLCVFGFEDNVMFAMYGDVTKRFEWNEASRELAQREKEDEKGRDVSEWNRRLLALQKIYTEQKQARNKEKSS